MSVRRAGLEFASDYAVPMTVYRSGRWGLAQRRWIAANFTHVLIDAMRPVTGSLLGDDCSAELPVLRGDGVSVALLAHGSDIRIPSRHRELYSHSPFELSNDLTRRLEVKARRLNSIMADFDGPTFVSTPDLLDFAPNAEWVPVVVDGTMWATDRPPLQRKRLVVLHIPSNPFFKGSDLIDPQLQRLHDTGLIEYRRLENVPPDQMPRHVADADILLDQFVIGNYTVTTVQGLCAGRVVVAHVDPRVRARVGENLPVVEAIAENIVEVVERIHAERDHFRAVADAGPGFAKRVHDGRISARVLAPFLSDTVADLAS